VKIPSLKTFIISSVVVALVGTIVFVLPLFISSSFVKNEVTAYLSKLYNSENIVIGDVSFRFFPRPKFIVKDIKVVQKIVVKGEEPLQIKNVIGIFSVSKFFKGQIVLDLDLVKPVAFITLDKNTKSYLDSYESFFGQNDEVGYKINKLNIEDGEIHLKNPDKGSDYIVEHLKLKASLVKDQDALRFPIKLSAVIKSITAKPVVADGNVFFDAKNKILEFENVSVLANNDRLTLDLSINYQQELHVFDATIASPSVNLDDLKVFLPFLFEKAPSDFSISGIMSMALSLHGNRNDFELSLQTDMTAAKIDWGKYIHKISGSPLKIAFKGSNKDDILKVDDLTLLLGSDSYKLEGSLMDKENYVVDLKLLPTVLHSEELSNVFPFLSFMRTFGSPKISMAATGPLFENEFVVNGDFESDDVHFADYVLTEVKALFKYSQQMLSLSPLQGKLLNGVFSGSADIDMSENQICKTQFVVDNLEAGKVIPLISGTGSLVGDAEVKIGENGIETQGIDFSGTFVLAKGKLLVGDIGEKVLTDEVWNIFKKTIAQDVNSKAVNKLKKEAGNISDLKLSFNTNDSETNITDMQWKNPDFNAYLNGSLKKADGVLEASGNFVLSKQISAELILNKEALKKIVNVSGEISVPVKVSGTISEIVLAPDLEILTQNMENLKDKPLVKDEKEVPDVKQGATPNKKKNQTKNGMTTNVDQDVFKVIIGE